MRNITKIWVSLVVVTLSLSVQAAESLQVSKDITVNAQAATVWKMIGNFNGLDVWHPVVIGSEITSGKNDELGSVRKLTLGNGATISEKLLAYSGDGKQYRYQILESPLPVQNYVSSLTVSDAGEGKTKITWQSTFQAKGVADEEAVQAITGVYDAGLNHVQAIFQ